MNLCDASIKNPVFAVMLSVAMIVFGYLGYSEMGVSQFPEIDFPVVSVAITLEGAPPDVVDSDVTDVVEDAISGVEGVDYVMSQSLQGASLVTIYFRLDRNIDVAMQEVQNAVAAARRKLPREIDPPVITKVNPNNLPVLWLTISGGMSVGKLSDFAEKELKPRLSAIADVGGVQFGGLRTRNVRIWLNPDQLRSYGLSADAIRTALQRQHVELPAGIINSAKVEFNVRIMAEAYDLEEIRNLLIDQRNGQAIYLKDVAVVEDGTMDVRTLARYNRLPAVAIGIRKAMGGNLVRVCENVKAELPQLRKILPPGVELAVPVDYSLFVRENIAEMQLTLLLGVLLTAIVCFLFLGSIGTTLNICLAIPTSLIGTFFVMRYGMELFGLEPFTINLMTLLALSLSVGVVVDDAILVLENIYRHREMGKSRLQAALEGSKEISFAAMAATFSIMAIFLPVAFMSGTIGKFFFQFGVTVGVAVFLSLICALTLTPMLCAFFLNVRDPKRWRVPRQRWELAAVVGGALALLGTGLRLMGLIVPFLADFGWAVRRFEPPQGEASTQLSWWAIAAATEFFVGFALIRYLGWLYSYVERFVLRPLLLTPVDWTLAKLTSWYQRSLRISLDHPSVILLCGLVLVLIAVGMLGFDVLGRELIPSEDQSRFVIRVIAPVGSSLKQVNDLVQECEDVLAYREDVAGILTTIGGENGQVIHEADIFVHLLPQAQRTKTQRQIMEEVRAKLEQIEDVRIVMRDLSLEGFTAQRGDPIDFALIGKWSELPALAVRIMDEMRASGMVQDIDCDYRPGMPEERIVPNREKLALLNIPVEQLASSAATLVGGQRVGKFTFGDRRQDIRIKLTEPYRESPNQIDPLPLPPNTLASSAVQMVPFSDVATRTTVSTLPVIHRYKHQRKIEITASPAPGVSQGEAIRQCQQIAQAILPSEEFQVVDLGNAQAMQETIHSLVFALILGVMIAYMILAVQFNSFVHPLTVLLALPFAVTGALVTLWLTGDTLNMMSLIGLILLMGLVKKNSIILVDYTNQLRAEGKSVREAILTACPIRLRPILMTSVACVAAAVPAAVGLGPGAETRAPMARGIIGGMLLSTLVTLLLVPVFYQLTERVRGWSHWLLETAPETSAAEAPKPAISVNGPLHPSASVSPTTVS